MVNRVRAIKRGDQKESASEVSHVQIIGDPKRYLRIIQGWLLWRGYNVYDFRTLYAEDTDSISVCRFIFECPCGRQIVEQWMPIVKAGRTFRTYTLLMDDEAARYMAVLLENDLESHILEEEKANGNGPRNWDVVQRTGNEVRR